MVRPVERVRGFYDVEPGGFTRWNAVLQRLVTAFELHGFRMVDVPIVEQLELYLRKNGMQVLSKLYSFTDQGNREVALRPEFTASVIRAFAAQAGAGREPLRVAYAGPVFRYEKPQRATMRQFTQLGVEVLGDSGQAADAEVLALACEAVRDLGLGRVRLVIGHLGPLRSLLAHLEVHGYAEEYLLEHLEYYGRGAEQRLAVRRRLGLEHNGVAPEDDDAALPDGLSVAIRDLGQDDARGMVGTILHQMGFELSGSTRTPEEIIDRVLQKARRRSELRGRGRRDSLERALEFLGLLGDLRGTPVNVLPRTEDLLKEYGVPTSALDELRIVLDLLASYDLGDVTIELAPGMARGIAYYSGLIFELYAEGATGEPRAPALQICGGGRYDGLAKSITGRAGFPALGFAFGLERVLHAMPAGAPETAPRPRVAVMLLDPAARADAQRLAQILRSEGVACVVNGVVSTAARAVDDAHRSGYDAALLVSAAPDTLDRSGPGRAELVTLREDEELERALRRLDQIVAAPAAIATRTGTGMQDR